jgi:restriction system protein
MKPILIILNKQDVKTRKELYNLLSIEFNLDETAKEEKYAGGERYYQSRISWALTFLKKAGLILSPERSKFEISEQGKEVLRENPNEINQKYLLKFDGFKSFYLSNNSKDKSEIEKVVEQDFTPEDIIEDSFKQYKKSISFELINKIHENSPEFFEKLVLELLWKMGYGEAKEDLKHTGKTNDKGIDGIVYEDKLGLGKIFIQAKRYDLNNSIDRATLQQFVGAMPAGFNKGIFVTLSKFNKNAEEFIKSGVSGKNIILIDGEKLADLLYDYKVGLQTKASLDINKIDYDYFEE